MMLASTVSMPCTVLKGFGPSVQTRHWWRDRYRCTGRSMVMKIRSAMGTTTRVDSAAWLMMKL